MITLKEAVKLTQIEDDEIVYIRYNGDSRLSCQVYSGKGLRDFFDMKRTNVIYILPHFGVNEYMGMEFILTR